MTVVSSKEFVSDQDKYFDLALDEQVFVKKGENIFHLICTNGYHTNRYDDVLEHGQNFRRDISADESGKKKEKLLNSFLDFAKNNYITDHSFKFNREDLYDRENIC